MFNRLKVPVVASLALGLSVVAAAADDLAAVETKIVDAWQKHKTIAAKMKTERVLSIRGMDTEAHVEGRYELLNTGEKILFRMVSKTRSVVRLGDHERRSEQQSTMVLDDKYVYTLVSTDGKDRATKENFSSDRSPNPKAQLEMLHKAFTLKLLPEEEVDGQKTYVIEALAKETGPQRVSRQVYHFRHDGILVKQVVYGPDGKVMQTTTITDIKLNNKLTPADFVFEPPPGVPVIDQTGEKQ